VGRCERVAYGVQKGGNEGERMMEGPTLFDIFLGLLPMLLLIGAWFFFMRMQRGGDFGSLEQRKVQALERIAAALERRQ
jgi:ATP-dependent Zn protease